MKQTVSTHLTPTNETTNPFLDFLLQMMGRKRLVLAICFFTVLMTAIYSLMMKKTYASAALILPPEGGGSPLSALVGSLPMGDLLGSMSGMGGGGGGGDYFLSLLNSRVMHEGVIEEFGLREHYGMESAQVEDVLMESHSLISASLDYESGMISLVVRDHEPALTQAICLWMIDRLEVLNLDFKVRRARASRLFISGEVVKLRAEVDSLEMALLSFQEREHILEPEAQAAAILRGYGELKGQEALKDLELKFALQRHGSSHPKAVQLRAELLVVQTQLRESYEEGDGDLYLAVADLPRKSLSFFRYKRELEIANQKFAFMLPQLEAAKIEEVNDTEVLEVIDPPRVPEKRIKPKRTVMVVISGILALLVSAVLVLFLDRLESNSVLARQWRELMDHIKNLLRLRLG
jgi:tyrosine-protein kinase Etk/Wzc